MQALSKERVPVLNIIAAQRDNITWWKFTSWWRRWSTHDHDHELIMRPKNVLARYSFLIGVESWNIYKREWVLSDIWIDDKLSYFTILHSDLTHEHQTKKKSFIRLTTWKYCSSWLLSLSCLSFSYANGPWTLYHKTFYNCSTFIGTIT
jgi:hypothetical protein